mmetsp:Transcript_7269/g.23999  ORF Transcript_7269/g.23999 Transcript_7269/m.23999 type:complete len:205 (+) Transcript_7269:239-853(+)
MHLPLARPTGRAPAPPPPTLPAPTRPDGARHRGTRRCSPLLGGYGGGRYRPFGPNRATPRVRRTGPPRGSTPPAPPPRPPGAAALESEGRQRIARRLPSSESSKPPLGRGRSARSPTRGVSPAAVPTRATPDPKRRASAPPPSARPAAQAARPRSGTASARPQRQHPTAWPRQSTRLPHGQRTSQKRRLLCHRALRAEASSCHR